MIGLVCKDLLCLRKSATSYLFVVVIYGLLTVVGVWDSTILATVMAVLVSMLPYSCFSYDNMAKWELYGLALPLRRSQIVLARYLTVLLALAFSAVLCCLFGGVTAALGQMEDWGLYLSSAIGALGFSVLLNAILLPLLYRFGAERARILFFGVLGAIIAVGIAVLSFFDVTGWLDGIEHVQWNGMLPVVGFAAVAAAVVLLFSYLISVGIYRKREL
ncbi:MAG: ABC-2 transporter permease [Clostridiales bacterium]|nr:ABC-2 transporter permease [Clostridiales bacterium]MDY4037227.1 ABC-2 transporter permease [Candidatus Pseudoscilispira sp.]